MRSLCFLITTLGLLSACGGSSKEPAATGGTTQSSSGTGNLGGDSGAAAGGSGTVAGSNSVAGSNDGGSVSSSGSSTGGASGGGATGGAGASAGGDTGDGGEPSLVDCDERKVTCKVAKPTCGTFQVPSVEGSCYGECVKIERCACSEAAECPDSGQFTCWKKTHCGPYVN